MSAPIHRINPTLRLLKCKSLDSIIDVRSPSEFLDDHMPHAINLPVLDDVQRVSIGTIYSQGSPFEAKRAGAALVAKNISLFLQKDLSKKDRNWRPLIYCWRGGHRSGAWPSFSDIGWHTKVIDGGYKAYRKMILDGLDQFPPRFQFIALSGPTGTAKTHILRAAAAMGAQVLDLEKLASHRGSLLGSEPGIAQPAQRLFETHIVACFNSFDPTRPVYIEAESNKIGQVHIPSTLWTSMRKALRVTITAPLAARVAFLQRDYRHLIENNDDLMKLLSGLRRRYSKEVFDRWHKDIKDQNWDGFVTGILKTHYDPSYARSTSLRPLTDVLALAPAQLDKDDIIQLWELTSKLSE